MSSTPKPPTTLTVNLPPVKIDVNTLLAQIASQMPPTPGPSIPPSTAPQPRASRQSPDGLLLPQEAAKKYHLRPETVYDLIHTKAISVVRRPGARNRWWVVEESLREWFRHGAVIPR